MLSKLATLVQSKIALAVLGVVLVGGGGTAAAVAATTGHVPFTGITIGHGSSQSSDGQNNSNADANHAHTKNYVGILTGSTGTTITVKTDDSGSQTFTVDKDTKINGDIKGKQITSVADLTSAMGFKVEVQTTDPKSGDTYRYAWKVTVSDSKSDNSGDTGDSTHGDHATPTTGSGDNTGDQQSHGVSGTIASVGTSSFVVTLKDGTTVTVDVNAQTHFSGSAHSFSDLKAGMTVSAEGSKQSDGTFLATSVEGQTND